MFLARLIAIAGVIGALAIVAPKLAPTLFASVVQPKKPAVIATAPVPQRRSDRAVALEADARGHFSADAVINGRSIEVFVDTGATTIALNEATARRLGISPARSEFVLPISTANGVIQAAPVRLAEVRLGGISVRDVGAVVVPGNVLAANLLGMSFLSRLSKFELSGDRLILVE